MDAQITEMPLMHRYSAKERFFHFKNVKSCVNDLHASATKYRDENDHTECKNIIKYIACLTHFTKIYRADTDTTICDYIAESLLNYNREFVDAKQ